MGGCLKNLVIAATGDFGPGKGPEQIRKWVDANGGRWSPRVKDGITHLIADKGAWKKNVDAVQQARRLAGVWIVSFDWLEDSLQKRRKLTERKYTWEVLRKQRNLSKTMRRLAPLADTKSFYEGCAKAREDTGSGTSGQLSSRSKTSHFVSALDDLREKREAREKEEKSRREAKAAQAANSAENAVAAPAIQDPGLGTLRQAVTNSSAAKPQPIFMQSKAKGKPTRPKATKACSTTAPPRKQSDPNPTSLRPSNWDALSAEKNPSVITSTAIPPSSEHSPAKSLKLTDNYHMFTDVKGFTYNLEFVRHNPLLNTSAKYFLRLYESNTLPHVYCTFARYTPPEDAAAKRVSSASNMILANPYNGTVHNTHSTSQMATTGSEAPSNHDSTSATLTPAEAEAARLRAILIPSDPTPNEPYKALIARENSSYETAFRAFRHAFRDITLLTWEEREQSRNPLSTPANGIGSYINTNTEPFSTQRLRAQAFNIEPFQWVNRPLNGVSGVFPVLPLDPPTPSPSPHIPKDPSYTPNAFTPPLPSLNTPLSPSSGLIGSALVREAAEAAEQDRRRADALLAKEKEKRREKARAKGRSNLEARKPLFNGVNGPPVRQPAVQSSLAPAAGRAGNSPGANRSSPYSPLAPSPLGLGAARGVQQHQQQQQSPRTSASATPHSPSSPSFTPSAATSPYRSPSVSATPPTSPFGAPVGMGPRRPAVFTVFKTGKKARCGSFYEM